MKFFGDLVSALQKLAADDVNVGQEIENLQAAETNFEQNVNAQVQAAITAGLSAAGLTPAGLSDLAARVTALEATVGEDQAEQATADTDLTAPPAGNTAPPSGNTGTVSISTGNTSGNVTTGNVTAPTGNSSGNSTGNSAS